jgi:hydroxymethylpyrimidine/phosphomethylpyrimidine kinase
MKYFLSIAASDSSGGAGIQQDMKMAQILSFWGLSIVTAITAQNLQKVFAMESVSPDILMSQCDSIFSHFDISAVKIGVIPSLRFAETLAPYLSKLSCPIVYDPVIISSSGFSFMTSPDECRDMIRLVASISTVVTPNIPEIEYILQQKLADIDISDIAIRLNATTYLKGGHSSGDDIVEYLVNRISGTEDISPSGHTQKITYPRYKWDYSHGTGCTFSSLLSMYMVDHDIVTASQKARNTLVEIYSADIKNKIKQNK